jgi:hypothetical protein
MREMPKFKSVRSTQKAVDVVINDGFIDFMRGSFVKNADFWEVVDRYFRKAMVIVSDRVKLNINAYRAIATGFMRANVVTKVDVDMGRNMPIKAEVGTMAWYDILIEKGLGRHSKSGHIPEKYRPTAAQLALIPTLTPAEKSMYWKPSPKVPRPFLSKSVKETKSQVKKIIFQGFKMAFKKMNVKGTSMPRHSITSSPNSAVRFA